VTPLQRNGTWKFPCGSARGGRVRANSGHIVPSRTAVYRNTLSVVPFSGLAFHRGCQPSGRTTARVFRWRDRGGRDGVRSNPSAVDIAGVGLGDQRVLTRAVNTTQVGRLCPTSSRAAAYRLAHPIGPTIKYAAGTARVGCRRSRCPPTGIRRVGTPIVTTHGEFNTESSETLRYATVSPGRAAHRQSPRYSPNAVLRRANETTVERSRCPQRVRRNRTAGLKPIWYAIP